MNPHVSILIDNYNYARFLRQAIDSALAQTYPQVEVVVVDDGSTDESREVIRSYGDKIRPVLKENGGQASAFNAGFAAARGEIIAFLDADDYLAPHAIERMLAAWREDTQIFHHRLREVDAEGKELGWNPRIEEKLDAGNVVPILLEKGFYGAPPTSGLAYHRELLAKILPMPEDAFRICADTYLFLAAPFFAPVMALDETLAYYRLHGANAHRETALRRHWQRKKMELTQRNIEMRQTLILDLAARQGFPVPDIAKWEGSGQLFERLLLLRSASSPGSRADLVGVILKKLGAETSSRLSARLRLGLLALVVWLAPRFLLRRIYPKMF